MAADTPEASPFFELLQAIDQPEPLAAVADAVQHARNRGETPLPAFVTALHAGTPRACRHLRRRRRAVTTDDLLTLVHGGTGDDDPTDHALGATGRRQEQHRRRRLRDGEH